LVKAYKGFDKELKCKGFQYEIGKEYEEEKAALCQSGFHACECPLDVLGYYPPSDSRYCEVELDNVSDERRDDTKVCGTKIKIGAEIGIKGLIKAQFEYVKERCANDKNGGDRSALTGGNRSALTGGDSSALTGGDSSALTGGDWSALTGGDRSALTGGDWSALTGGDSSALTGGGWSNIRGGVESRYKGGMWSVFSETLYDDKCNITGVAVAVVDGEKIKPNVWYKVVDGEFVEVAEDDADV